MNPLFQIDGASLKIMLPPEVDHPVSDTIRRETDRILEERYIRTMVFDFQDTNFMDSSGIGLLMGRYRALGMRKDCIRAINANAHVQKLLQLSGVHKYIEISGQK